MVFRDYRRSTRREHDRDWPGEPRGRETDFRFQYEPVYEFYRDRWRGVDSVDDWRRQPRDYRTERDPDFRFQYEPVYEFYRDRWNTGGEVDRQPRAAPERDPDRDRSSFFRPRRRNSGAGGGVLDHRRPGFSTQRVDDRKSPKEWKTEGPYTGCGPSGYHRSDERLLDEANERLTLNGWLDASQIHVAVQNGEVTLTGTVKSRRDKRLAADTVEDIPGVRNVINHLRVPTMEEDGRTPGYWGETAGMGGRLCEGMAVIGRDGDFIGTVKRVRANDFLLDRPWAREVTVPFTAIRRLHRLVELSVDAGTVGDEDWLDLRLF